eukprot:6878317-Prymnesium_polylepis.1
MADDAVDTASASELTLSVRGMMCGHCTSSVDAALRAVEGVESVTVDLEEGGRARIVGSASIEALIAAVEAAGFSASAAEPAHVTLAVRGLTCGHCTSTVDAALRAVEGVENVTVDLEEGGRARVVGSAS